MNLQEIASIISLQKVDNIKFKQIKTNSKEIVKGDVFLVIGSGYNYIDEAINNGAIAVITEIDVEVDIIVIKVKSAIEALGKLGSFYRDKYNIPLIAITGSCGKTTTKEFIVKLLETKYKVLKTEKNYNNHIGLPNTLLKLNDDYNLIVTEMGMNHFKEISYLSSICKPNVAVITNIGSAHIGNLGSKKNILKAKLEILDGMNNGKVFLNSEDKMLKKLKLKNYEAIKKNKYISNVKYFENHTEFDLKINKFKNHVIFNIPSKHMLIDLALSISVAISFSVDINDIIEVINNLKNENGRFNIIKDKYTVIDDSYNSSYESLKESLEYIKHNKNKKIIILGDMLELGKFSKKYHKKINKKIKKIKNKEVLLTGNETKVIKGKHFDNLISLKLYLNHIISEGCIILIKGSNATNLHKLVENIKNND